MRALRQMKIKRKGIAEKFWTKSKNILSGTLVSLLSSVMPVKFSFAFRKLQKINHFEQ